MMYTTEQWVYKFVQMLNDEHISNSSFISKILTEYLVRIVRTLINI